MVLSRNVSASHCHGSGRNGDGDGWVHVSRRNKKDPKPPHFSDHPSITTFYIPNLPEDCSSNKLWRMFEHRGKICDSFVSKRRDKQKSIFDFVKFKEVSNPFAMEEELNTVKWNGAVLSVNLARFDRNHQPITYGSKQPSRNPKPQSSPVFPTPYPTRGMEHPPRSTYGIERSYKDAFHGVDSRQSFGKIIDIDEPKGSYPHHCYRRSVLIEAISMDALNGLGKLLLNGGFHNHTISYLGGLKALIIFKDKQTATLYISNKLSVWGELLISASLWNGEDVASERIAKIKVWGVPILLRDSTTYDKIGSILGKKVLRSSFSWGEADNSHGECLILTNSGPRVDEEISLKSNGRVYKVWVIESEFSWSPSFPAHEDAGDLDDGEINGGVGQSTPGSRTLDGGAGRAGSVANCSAPTVHGILNSLMLIIAPLMQNWPLQIPPL